MFFKILIKAKTLIYFEYRIFHDYQKMRHEENAGLYENGLIHVEYSKKGKQLKGR